MENNIQKILNDEFDELILNLKYSESNQMNQSMSELEDKMKEIFHDVSTLLEEIIEPYTGNNMKKDLDSNMLDAKEYILSHIQSKEEEKIYINRAIDQHTTKEYQNIMQQNSLDQEELIKNLSHAALNMTEQISEEKKQEHNEIERNVLGTIENYVKTELPQSLRSKMMKNGLTSEEKYYDVKNILKNDLCVPLQDMYKKTSQKEIQDMKAKQINMISEMAGRCKVKISQTINKGPNDNDFKQGLKELTMKPGDNQVQHVQTTDDPVKEKTEMNSLPSDVLI